MPLSSPPLERYVYQPLYDAQGNSTKERIRLLVLSPGNYGSKIQCSLKTVSLSMLEDQYIALSYVWGDPTVTRSIEVNGNELPVTKNLENALQHMRDQIAERTMWIDAICVDQENEGERSQQVQLMVDIYKNAFGVHVWLDSLDSRSDRALNFIESLTEQLGRPTQAGGIYGAPIPMTQRLTPHDISDYISIAHLFQKRYSHPSLVSVLL
jgi:hypothetical protein